MLMEVKHSCEMNIKRLKEDDETKKIERLEIKIEALEKVCIAKIR